MATMPRAHASTKSDQQTGSTPLMDDYFHVTLKRECDALAEVTSRLAGQRAQVAKAVTILGSGASGVPTSTRVIVSGVGKAGLIARKVAATLSSMGTAATFLHPVEALHGDLGFVRPDDRGLLFSYSGESVEVVRLARELDRIGCPLVAITRSAASSLGRMAAACLQLGNIVEACPLGLAPSSTTTVMLAVGDALALCTAQLNGFREEEFAHNHPAGALGLRFRNVASEMRVGDRLVCVRPETTIADVVRLVSAARTGAAVLTSEEGLLIGIFTDGDLRRSLLRDRKALDQPVIGFATSPCHAISAMGSLADALRHFGQTRTEELPVLDEARRVVGVLVLKDISTF
jgi:KpsF/GutQ family protein